MTKHPLVNALLAALYITVVAVVMFYGQRLSGPNHEDTIVAPIAMISLFTLSAAVMGYLFVYQPLQLYFEGNKQGAAILFLRTVGIFAIITTIMLATLIFGTFI